MGRTAFIIGITAVFASIGFGLAGSGTVDDPWRIRSVADFNEFVDSWWRWEAGQHTRLETDVNLAGVIYSDAPIASERYPEGFRGVFDGNDHKVTGLTIESVGNTHVGLFGLVDGGAIKNLGLEDCSIRAQEDNRWNFVGGLVGESKLGYISGCYFIGSVAGERAVGGLVGSSHGDSIVKCYSKGNVNGMGSAGGLVGWSDFSFISGSYFVGDVDGGGGVGGLAGAAWWGSIANCYSIGDISGGDAIGGLVGYHAIGNLVSCYSAGEVIGTDSVGGLVGVNYAGSVSHCYSGCDVNGVEDVGAIVGKNGDSYSDGSVSNCFWNVDAQSHGVIDGIGADYGTVSNVIALSRADMQTARTFTSSGWDFMGERANGTSETWQMGGEDGYPVLSIFHSGPPFPLGGSGTIEEPYLIGDANELGMVNWYLGSLHVGINQRGAGYWYSSNFKLVEDIDLSGINWSVAVAPGFSDYFDGDGHRLMNMRMSGGSYLGFVGFLGRGYLDGFFIGNGIENLGIDGCFVEGTGDYIGGLAGFIYGSAVSNCYSGGLVTGYNNVGGLAGEVYNGYIYSCYSSAETRGTYRVGGLVGEQFARSGYSTMRECYSTGNVTGRRSVGGLIGGMSDGYSADPFTESRAHVCYSIGDVNGVEDVGGLIGEARGDIQYCYWNTETQTHGVTEGVGSGGDTGVAGRTTEAMKTRAAYFGFDFDRSWNLDCEGMSYPRLVWAIPPGDLVCPNGIDWRDFPFFAEHWMESSPCGPRQPCVDIEMDFDSSHTVDWRDLSILFENWLAGGEE